MDRSPAFVLTEEASIRILEVLRRGEVRGTRARLFPPFFRRVCQVLREVRGIDLEDLDYRSLEDVMVPAITDLDGSTLSPFALFDDDGGAVFDGQATATVAFPISVSGRS